MNINCRTEHQLSNIHLKVQQMVTTQNAINAAAGRHIPQRIIKTVVANCPSEAVKISERDEIQGKYQGEPKTTQLIHEKNKFVESQKRRKLIEFVQTLTHRGSCFKLCSIVK